MVCGTDDKIAESRGCKGQPAPKPVIVEVYEGRKIKYWNCPRKFIPKQILAWFDKYKYHTKFQGATMEKYEDQMYRFIQACNVYEMCLAQFEKEKR